jgi:hypothetical protein
MSVKSGNVEAFSIALVGEVAASGFSAMKRPFLVGGPVRAPLFASRR